ncbi:hypothetical protein L1856_17670 [Streptomyces sp. Tue 6430]|nr:hypothetical protein [Streptomyces sp. Tue 6430]
MRKLRYGLLAGAAMVLLAACTGAGGGGKPQDNAPEAPGGSASSAASSAPAAARAQVPPAFDGGKGWAVMQSEHLTQPSVAPNSRLVLLLKTYEDGKAFGVEAREAATGAVRWASAPWKPSENPEEFDAGDVKLVVTSKDGKDYAVLTAAVNEGADVVNHGTHVVNAAVFPASSSGTGVAPARTVKIPGAELVIAHPGDGTVLFKTDSAFAVADVTTGDLKAPLAQGSREYQLAAGGGKMVELWPGQATIPDGANPRDDAMPGSGGQVMAVKGGYVVASWQAKNQAYSALGLPMNYIWALHDERGGQPVFTLACEGLSTGLDGQGGSTVLSDNGRYLVAVTMAFDLQAKKGYCFGATDDRSGVNFTGVGNNGVAYGTSGPAARTPVSVDLATGTAADLGGARLPDYVSGDVALYTSAPQNEKDPAADLSHHAVLSVYPTR